MLFQGSVTTLSQPRDPRDPTRALMGDGRNNICLLLCFCPRRRPLGSWGRQDAQQPHRWGVLSQPHPSWATRLVLWLPESEAGSPARDPGLTGAPRAGAKLLREL